ncbi:hypothetical protein JM79_2758 [Gramella sp. Hel_I_59]|uniref:hypothetical protein n=1 Tax=Gramella sp. Hel_I_59 TaxID=1249978 RepID=UPI001170D724|nr:hypothetical protein [Gramella sp. Hel_I_59]TQI71809.1 hypothetical protein JM79_2758 [Gramella sp. Hel_I_59]
MTETISRAEVLKIMRTPNEEGRAVPFDISYRTFNRNSKTGGKMVHLENVKLVMKEKGLDPDSVYALKNFKPSEEQKEKIRKNPNHFGNKTRNIRLENGKVTKIGILWIKEFNGKTVVP